MKPVALAVIAAIVTGFTTCTSPAHAYGLDKPTVAVCSRYAFEARNAYRHAREDGNRMGWSESAAWYKTDPNEHTYFMGYLYGSQYQPPWTSDEVVWMNAWAVCHQQMANGQLPLAAHSKWEANDYYNAVLTAKSPYIQQHYPQQLQSIMPAIRASKPPASTDHFFTPAAPSATKQSFNPQSPDGAHVPFVLPSRLDEGKYIM